MSSGQGDLKCFALLEFPIGGIVRERVSAGAFEHRIW